MSRKIFVNLPVADLKKSMSFFKAIGFNFNPQFTSDDGACMVITDDIYAMLLTHQHFNQFIPSEKSIANAAKSTEVLVCLSCESRAEVDAPTTRALNQGVREPRPPQELGFMYGRSFEDPDGHIWELVWMDPSAIEPQ